MSPTDSQMTDRTVVRCVALTKTFGLPSNALHALRGATCEIARGSLIALTGRSGSGKSTFLHLLAGIDEPTTGSITWPAIGGRESLRPGPVAMVFQGPSLLPPLDVLENVALPLVLAGASDEGARSASLEALRLLGLADLATRLPEELSGGQAQRACVARVLAGRPQFILADEPTGQLDGEAGARVVDLLLETAAHLGAALLLSTHDPVMAERLPTQWHIDDGFLRTDALATRAAHSRGALDPEAMSS